MKSTNSSMIANRLKIQFPFMTNDEIALFLSICTLKNYKAKEAILDINGENRHFAIVITGVIRGYFVNKEGIERNVMLRPEGTAFGTPEALSASKNSKYTFESILDSALLIFNLESLEVLAKKHAGIFDMYIWGLKENIAVLHYRVESMVDLSPEERYQDLLKKYPHFFQTVFNKHIANFLGITPVSLSRIIARIKNTKTKLSE